MRVRLLMPCEDPLALQRVSRSKNGHTDPDFGALRPGPQPVWGPRPCRSIPEKRLNPRIAFMPCVLARHTGAPILLGVRDGGDLFWGWTWWQPKSAAKRHQTE